MDWHSVLDILLNSYFITSLVLVMMIMIEFVNVGTSGRWLGRIQGSSWKQVLTGSLLGLIPGCVGGFAAVSLYSHGMLSMGGLVAAMISSSGDESFVMLAMIPKQALVLFGVLFVIAIICGLLTDKVFRKSSLSACVEDHTLDIHEEESGHFPKIFRLSSYRGLRNADWQRVVLILFMLVFAAAVFSGVLEHEHDREIQHAVIHGHEGHHHAVGTANLPFNFLSERWLNILFGAFSVLVAFQLAASSNHFVKEHIWNHVVRKHALKTFLWTAGALAVIMFGMQYVDVTHWIKENTMYLIVLAALVGMIPESGPHIIFITLFAGGVAPFSVLLTSSISQDGHTSIPLLASNTRSFLYAKLINAGFAILVGTAFYLCGF